jgi:UrcA family protein
MTRFQMALAVAAVAALPFMSASAEVRSPDLQVSSPWANHSLRSVAVSYADLNLRKEAGVAKLTSRVASAVREVCEPRNYTDLAQFRPTLTCRHISMERAKADIAVAITKVSSGDSAAALQVEVRS